MVEQPKTIEEDGERIEAKGQDIKSSVDRAENLSCIDQDFGCCNKCGSFFYVQYELGSYKAYCMRFSHSIGLIPKSHTKKIEKCTEFSPKGEMSLWDMKELAWEIQGKNKKEIKGFGKDKK